MLIAIVVILIILWVLGYAPISGISVPNIVLITINNHPVTLWEILILIVVGWVISILPRPFQAVGSILLVLWILSVLGIIAIAGLPNIIILVIIVGIIVSIFL
ncbi:hypothetical protein C4559_05650 [Candidatus Microgenomates bacterium]|nr:MAG: hypothetical protein C4559_05650 [Candidatus Microgenomates bacterium]